MAKSEVEITMVDKHNYHTFQPMLYFAEADRATLHWAELVDATPASKKLPRSYHKIWQNLTKKCGYNFGFRADFTSSPGGQ